MRVVCGLAVLICMSSSAWASPQVCVELPTISRDFTAEDFNQCTQAVDGKTFDFFAFSMCRDLNRLANSGATAAEINRCLSAIRTRRFDYKKLRSCKHSPVEAKGMVSCIVASSV
jgi:hypothetical protein